MAVIKLFQFCFFNYAFKWSGPLLTEQSVPMSIS